VNRLEPILATAREEVARRQARAPLADVQTRAAERGQDRRDFASALARPGLSLIAEHKRRSPSAGLIREGVTLAEVVGGYERAGAAALSILTEGVNFGGSLDDLRQARDASGLPILRKDFIVDPYQVYESAAAGADAILLIVAALSRDILGQLHDLGVAQDLTVLVEVHDGAELEAAAHIGASVIGINNRDLTTLEVDTKRTFDLLPSMPDGAVVVAESGFGSHADLELLAEAGVDAVLIGEALMRSENIEAACRELIGDI